MEHKQTYDMQIMKWPCSKQYTILFTIFMSAFFYAETFASICCVGGNGDKCWSQSIGGRSTYRRTFNNFDRSTNSLAKHTTVSPHQQSKLSTTPVITYGDMINVYDPSKSLQMFYSPDAASYTMNLGIVDLVNPQTWTLPAFTVESSEDGKGIAIADAPFRNYFPDATHCKVYTSPDDIFYEFYEFNSTEGINLIGSVDSSKKGQPTEIDTSDMLMMPPELNITTSFAIADSETVGTTKTVYNETMTVEGFGTLKTPDGDIEVLKISNNYNKSTYTVATNTLIEKKNNPVITFLSKDGHRIDLELADNSPTTGDAQTVEWISYQRIGTGFLPVELTSFSGVLKGSDIYLQWSTSTEANCSKFEIENKQVDGSWKTIGEVPGSGNSNSEKNYSFTDCSNSSLQNLYYRLKQVDSDGKFKYSEEIMVSTTTPHEFALRQNYPNPFNPTTSIQFDLKEGGMVTLKIFDQLGKEVASLIDEDKPSGTYIVDFPGGQLPSGVYYCRLHTRNFTQTRRMMLMK